METNRQQARPEYLKPRLDSNPEKWRARVGAPLIAAVFADAGAGEIIAPNDPTPLGKLLRTYSLVRARYDLTEPETAAKAWGRNEHALAIARTWYAQHLTNSALGVGRSAWNDGTGSALAAQAELLKPAHQFAATLPHLMTNQARAMLRTIGEHSPEAVKVLQKLRDDATEYLTNYMSRPDTENNNTRPNDTPCRRDENRLMSLTDLIERASEDYYDALTPTLKNGQNENGEPANGDLEPEYDTSGRAWYPAILARTNLNRPHIGKIGARKSPSDSGRTLKYPSRALTDPARRVFQKKQRAKSAVVVLDMSGSMDYTTEQLDQIIEAARGAVVVGYSADNDTDPNTYLLAKDGYRVSEIPEVCGANGNDKTALVYAINKYRKTSATPVIWVSDGHIGGAHGYNTAYLARDMVATLNHYKVHQCFDADEAIALMEKMEHGHKARTHIHAHLLHFATR